MDPELRFKWISSRGGDLTESIFRMGVHLGAATLPSVPGVTTLVRVVALPRLLAVVMVGSGGGNISVVGVVLKFSWTAGCVDADFFFFLNGNKPIVFNKDHNHK
jgi:hypothetical protein